MQQIDKEKEKVKQSDENNKMGNTVCVRKLAG